MRTFACAAMSLLLPALATAAPATTTPATAPGVMQDRFVWLFGIELSEPGGMAKVEGILDGAVKHEINGVVASGGADELAGLQAVCDRLGLELIPAQFSFGYGGPFLKHNRNLAEGLQVVDAPFVAGTDGKATLVPDPDLAIVNGDFETHNGDRFKGFGFHDAPGVISFADAAVTHGGTTAMRLTNFASDRWGHGRVSEKVKVLPRRCYRVSIWAKSQDLKAEDFKIMTLVPGKDERTLSHRSFKLGATADWTKVEYVFNSGKYTDVLLYAGVWGGQSGTLWLDDWSITEIGPMNPLRRPGTPVSVKGADGKRYEEGKDFARIEDPELHPWSLRPDLPITLLPGSRIKPGTKLKVSWYHPMIVHDSQVTVCMAEPEIYRIVDEEAKALIEKLHPKRIMLNQDEIRMGGTCKACAGRNMGELLGQSITKIMKIVRKHDPKVQIYCWSDMFDPNHNAKPGAYYHVQGDYTGSWKHIPKDLVMAIWGDKAEEKSFKFFSDHGFKILGSCYYDTDTLDLVPGWVAMARKYRAVRGLMYTTWVPKYELLPAFGDLLATQ
ncbi:MAG: carbohydrate binding domain-containing protein [Candidatus Coatesbacteria bacterium]